MNIETKRLEQLNPAPYNPRKDLKPGDPLFEKLKQSIETFGFVEPIIWNKRTGNVVGGHQRLAVLRELGKQEAECVVVDLDEQNEKALNIALNKIQGEWDQEKLEAVLQDLDATDYDTLLTGFGPGELEKLLNEDDKIKEDVAPEPEEKTGTKAGDLFRLGRHRLMCGDGTKPEDVRKLMGGVRPTLWSQTLRTTSRWVSVIARRLRNRDTDARTA